MNIIGKLLVRFAGLHYRQEYLCLALQNFSDPLYVYASQNHKVAQNLTSHHLFVGYCPVIIATPLTGDKGNKLHLVFCSRVLNENEPFHKKDVLAEVFLEKIEERNVHGTDIFFYRAISGRHSFLSRFHQWVISLNNSLSGKKAGNVFLKGNLLKQVQIAYSIPRKICLISVGGNGTYNLFPTDLHGQINEDVYIISLRHQGKACEQVVEWQHIVLSDIEAIAYKKVYALGKNHMQPLKPRKAFEFSHLDSAEYHLPLPQHVVAYKELQLISSFVEGIHRLLIFRIRNTVEILANTGSLAHIHTVYGTWRENKGFQSNYLLR